MRRFLVIGILMAFVTSAGAAEKHCEECKSTWTQWFGNTAVFLMAEQFAAAQLPWLAQLNTFLVNQAVTSAGLAMTWVNTRRGALKVQ